MSLSLKKIWWELEIKCLENIILNLMQSQKMKFLRFHRYEKRFFEKRLFMHVHFLK